MSLKNDLEEMQCIENPTVDDYTKLLTFTGSLLRLLHRERKSRSALNKKNRKLAARLGLDNNEV